MKKILFLLLCTVSIYGQTTTGQEQEFDYGIKNNSTQTITTPPYLTTTGMDGTQGKIPSALIEKTDNKQNSLAVDGTGTKYPTVDAVNTGLALKALDSNVIHKTGNETKTGTLTINNPVGGGSYFIGTQSGSGNDRFLIKLFNNGSVNSSALKIDNQSDAYGINLVNISTGIGSYIGNNSNGTGFKIDNSSTGVGLILNNGASATGYPFVIAKNNIVKSYINDSGDVNGVKFVKTGAPSTNLLLAGGGDLAQNTAFNKNFGTTAGTVAEGNDSRILNGQTAFGWGNHAGLYLPSGGTAVNSTKWNGLDIALATYYSGNIPSALIYNSTNNRLEFGDLQTYKSWLGLGSNAYTSTAYLPLSGGALSGSVTAPTAPVGTNTTQIATTAFVQTEISNNTVSRVIAPDVVIANGATTAIITLASNASYLGHITYLSNKTRFKSVIFGVGQEGGSVQGAINVINDSAGSQFSVSIVGGVVSVTNASGASQTFKIVLSKIGF